MRKLLAVATGLILALGFAAPAQASWNDCDPGRFCTWANTNYWGAFDQYFVPSGGCFNTYQSNSISSVRNNRAQGVYIYEGPGCTRAAWLVSGYQSYSPLPTGWDNQIQSIYLPRP